MRGKHAFSRKYAVSEITGGLLLLLIAIGSFAAIYSFVFPLPIPPANPNVEFAGYVNRQGFAVVEHKGGDPLHSYEIYVDGELTYTSDGSNPWEIGEKKIPDINKILNDENDEVRVTILTVLTDGTKEKVFDGIIRGKTYSHESQEEEPNEDSILISTLRTNTIDEDLICFSNNINSTLDVQTYIYNWKINGGSIENILYTFDTNNILLLKDYSGGINHGTPQGGPIWTSNGIVGGAYILDGIDDYISIPYCYNDEYIDRITVETWVKTDSDYGTIASFGRDNYWEIGLNNGKIRWSTNSGDTTSDLVGNTQINDNQWHYIATSYNYLTGRCKIYVDGNLDKNEIIHETGDKLGSGDQTTGTIGQGTSTGIETILSTSFETQEEKNKWTIDNDRTTDWAGYNIFDLFGSDTINPHSGSYSLGGSGDLYYWWSRHYAAYNRESIDISNYEQVKVGIWYSYKNTEDSDRLGFYYKEGNNWIPVFQDFNPNIGEGNQKQWTYAEVEIPDSIDNLILQFWWSTSDSREYMAIDDLIITGMRSNGGTNYSGTIDEFIIYNRALSDEQIYQNYLCKKDGLSDKSIIVSDETYLGNIWKCNIIPNDGTQDDIAVESNEIEIVYYPGGGI